MTNASPTHRPEPGVFRMSASVYAERDGKILLLKRGGGELTGAWYLPGGGVDVGETVEQAAVRELMEEAGLAPSGPLRLIGIEGPNEIYGVAALQVAYACECSDGEVVLSDEHTAFRWIDALEYRDRFFGDAQLARVAEGDPRRIGIVAAVRKLLDGYLAQQEHDFEDAQLRGRTTVRP